MITKTQNKTKGEVELRTIQKKAAILDELLELIEDKYFGNMMNAAEKEKNISLRKAEKFLA